MAAVEAMPNRTGRSPQDDGAVPLLKLSFVIPAYNEEAYLRGCLESIIGRIKKSAVHAEIIVVNNGSMDKTRERGLSFPDVTVVDEPAKGLPRARQAGYRAAAGDLIANVDADNLLPEGWLERVFDEFSKDDSLVALSGPLVYHDLSRLGRLCTRFFYYIAYVSYLLTHYVLKTGGMLQGGNFVLRKSALETIGGYNTDIEFYGEDTDIARRMQAAGRIKFTFGLPMYSSGRRLAEEGVLATALRYAVNYLWVLTFKRPYTRMSTEVRLKEKGPPPRLC
ncbi:MAG: glycosyltransferase family 2 protein [Syntrophorhabdales bacterium]|jgi:cellulose synthase/poly-beta-1,6-N-acetylglucosamine synthase-like glycosyltransferase